MMDESEDNDDAIAIPEWVVTFGDMMSLLLTFFIMLVSLSEIKEEEMYQALVESMRQQFGYAKTQDSLTPGESRPRPMAFQVIATVGRAKQKDTARGGVPEKAPQGEEQHVRIIRPGRQTAVGTVIFFELGSTQLGDAARRGLDAVAEQIRGKPQKVEVRGHTEPEVAARAVTSTEPMDLAYSRCRAAMKYLIEHHQIDANRFRLSTAGGHEPMYTAGDAEKMTKNPRVEVFLLDETTDDLRGSTPLKERDASAQRTPGDQQTAGGGTDG